MPEEVTPQTPTPAPTPELSPLEEAKTILESLKKTSAEAKTEADRLEKLKAENLLSGTAGVRPVIKNAEETAGQYAQRMLRGGR